MENKDGKSSVKSGNQLQEKKKVEREMRTSKRRFKSIYENLEQGICLHEVIYEDNKAIDYRILDANSAYEDILGISLAKAIGSLGSEIYETDKPPYLDIYTQVAETQKSVTFEDYYPPVNKHFHITVTSVEKGKFIVLFKDITKKKLRKEKIRKSEKKYKKLFNRAPIGIFRTNSEGKLILINPDIAEKLGFSNVNKALNYYNDLGQDLYVNSGQRKKFLKVLKEKGEVTNFEFEAKRTDGKHIWVSINARINKRYDNGTFEIEGFFFDITERKRNEEQLQKQKEELQASNEELTVYSEEVTAMNKELEDSVEKINELNERFVDMINLVSSLHKSSNDKSRDFLSDLLKTAIKIVPEADYGKICLFDEEDNCKFIDTIGHNIELLKTTNINKNILFNFNEEGTYLLDEYSLNLSRLPKDKRQIFDKALKPISKSMYINIKVKSEVVGRIILDIAESSNQDFSSTTKHLLKSFANLSSAFFSLQKYNELQGEFTRELILSIIQILEMYDRYTGGHSQHVAELGADIAKKMGLSEEDVEATYWAGMVHDLGKMLVPLDILNKKGSLTETEYDIIKKHPYWSYKALNKSRTLRVIAKYVLYHHERWDGNGYPEGLTANQIPLVSQILTVVDAWDAMTSERAYREPLPKEAAIHEIEKNKGKQFSPEVVDIFLDYI